ncbi:MAG: DUF1904 domain-containing protein [Spirochaetes bacterium]|nr:DUF1904 domain-containing protein [Spirochaetota bacterium]MBU0956091.1 DUF1904 domain-containing protein [Spirochaetota bacterium]
MPHLRVRNIDQAALLAASTRLVDRLQEAIGCDRSWLTIEHEHCAALRDGQVIAGNPFVQVLWFPRPAPLPQQVAAIIAEELRGQADFVTVVFTELTDSLYFENGQTV